MQHRTVPRMAAVQKVPLRAVGLECPILSYTGSLCDFGRSPDLSKPLFPLCSMGSTWWLSNRGGEGMTGERAGNALSTLHDAQRGVSYRAQGPWTMDLKHFRHVELRS